MTATKGVQDTNIQTIAKKTEAGLDVMAQLIQIRLDYMDASRFAPCTRFIAA